VRQVRLKPARLWAANIRAEGAELVSREQTQLLLIDLHGRLRAAI
jgi:hypothetical protein